ncbi:hypothetical protein OHU45_12750 [Streptomyces tubercidicus]|uniref:hypothetical protein n=1 Tax=Streptomyces tubercidicus TaxID=47759 RepID=UPI002E167B05|nr:hypothetical protein OG761_12475 [Streptomyces tubercidicus]WSX25482.1 hypothetical protein OG690_24540 [Streptomyces tubercidicus]
MYASSPASTAGSSGTLPAAADGRPVADPCPGEHGRGLDIITALAAECGTRVHPGGITWWAELLAA